MYKIGKNSFGVFNDPGLQTALGHAVKRNYLPDKYAFINNLKQVNKNLKKSLILDDLEKMEMYFHVNRHPKWFTLVNQLTSFINDDTMWTKHEYSMWATFLIKSVKINNFDQFGNTLWETPGPLRPSNKLLMGYIKLMGKPNLSVKQIYDFCYNNFTINQLAETYF